MAKRTKGVNSINDMRQKWTQDASTHLVGRKIIGVRWLDRKECAQLGWPCSSVVLVLDNGICLFPSRDDEGNGPGALFTNIQELQVLPVMSG